MGEKHIYIVTASVGHDCELLDLTYLICANDSEHAATIAFDAYGKVNAIIDATDVDLLLEKGDGVWVI